MNITAAQQAQSILSKPGLHIDVVGSRPSFLRQITRYTLDMALISSLSTLAVLGAGKFGAIEEIQAFHQNATVQVLAPEKVHWLNLPSSSFLEAGRVDGEIQPDLLVQRWKASGLSEEQITQVSQKIGFLSPVLMGRNDPELEQHYQKEAAIVVQYLSQTFPEAEKNLSALIKANSDVYSEMSLEENWLDAEIVYKFNPDNAPHVRTNIPDDVTVADQHAYAKQALEKAVQSTGLRSLRLPVLYASSPQYMYSSAVALEKANEELQSATGMTGQVLGLSGRVELFLGSPLYQPDLKGVVNTELSGRIRMASVWEELGHEWLHALDRVVASEVLVNPGLDLMTRALKPLRLTKDGNSYTVWKKGVQGIEEMAPEWMSHKTSIPQEVLDRQGKEHEHYWQSKTETMAFAFSAYLNTMPDVKVLRNHTASDIANEPKYAFAYPSQQESQKQIPVWHALFAGLSSLKITHSPAPSISQWKASRDKIKAHPMESELTWR